jgi:hypothetical protein
MASFMDLLYSSEVRRSGEDKVCWNPSKCRVFEVKYFYKVLNSYGGLSLPWKGIWKPKVPSRVG